MQKQQPAATPTAILLMSCPDQPGIVSAISGFISENSGNILHLEQHVDSEVGAFFMRVEWAVDGFAISRSEIKTAFSPLAEKFSMDWALHFSDIKPRVAIFVTKDNHCIYDLLSRYERGELPMEVPLIVSNRMDLKPAADRFGIGVWKISRMLRLETGLLVWSPTDPGHVLPYVQNARHVQARELKVVCRIQVESPQFRNSTTEKRFRTSCLILHLKI